MARKRNVIANLTASPNRRSGRYSNPGPASISGEYLDSVAEAINAAQKTKTVSDQYASNDFYATLGTAVPGWQSIQRNSVDAIRALSSEAASLAQGDAPDSLMREIDTIAATRNRGQGRYGTAADFSRIKLRSSERQRLQTAVAPELLTRALGLLDATEQKFSPRRLDFFATFQPHLQNLIPVNMMTAAQRAGINEQARSTNLSNRLANRSAGLNEDRFAEEKRQDALTRKWNEEVAQETKEFQDKMIDRLEGLFGSDNAGPDDIPNTTPDGLVDWDAIGGTYEAPPSVGLDEVRGLGDYEVPDITGNQIA